MGGASSTPLNNVSIDEGTAKWLAGDKYDAAAFFEAAGDNGKISAEAANKWAAENSVVIVRGGGGGGGGGGSFG